MEERGVDCLCLFRLQPVTHLSLLYPSHCASAVGSRSISEGQSMVIAVWRLCTKKAFCLKVADEDDTLPECSASPVHFACLQPGWAILRQRGRAWPCLLDYYRTLLFLILILMGGSFSMVAKLSVAALSFASLV